MVFRSIVALGASVLAVTSVPAFAQADQMAMMREMAANQLGVMEFCQDNGYVDADAVAAQRKALARVPQSGAANDAAEALGRKGTLSANGTQTTMASLASGHNTTVSAMCGQMGSAAKQAAAATATAGTMPGRPGMPTMPGMPAMPGGMPAMPGGMPAMPGGMPGMPSMPGTPSTTTR